MEHNTRQAEPLSGQAPKTPPTGAPITPCRVDMPSADACCCRSVAAVTSKVPWQQLIEKQVRDEPHATTRWLPQAAARLMVPPAGATHTHCCFHVLSAYLLTHTHALFASVRRSPARGNPLRVLVVSPWILVCMRCIAYLLSHMCMCITQQQACRQ